MSRKIDAASSGAVLMSFVRRSRWKSNIVKPAKIDEAEHGVDQRPVRDVDEDRHDPEHDQREQRPEADAGERAEVAPGRVAERAEAGDEERRRRARLPEGLRVARGVVGESRGHREPDQHPEGEEEEDRELLGAPHREVHPDQTARSRR